MHRLFYRIYRLRRVFALCALPPLAVVWLLTRLDVPFLHTVAWFAVQASWLHILGYPRVWNESLAISLTLAIAIVPSSLIVTGYWLISPGWFLFGYGFGTVFLFLGVVWVCLVAPTWGRRMTFTLRSRRFVAAPPELVRALAFISPDRMRNRSRCGPLEPDGTIRVSIPTLSPTHEEPNAVFDSGYRARMLDKGPEHQSFACFSEVIEGLSTIHVRVTPAPGGCIYEYREISTFLTPLGRFGMWLCDWTGDEATELADEATGRPNHALVYMPYRTFLVDLSFMIPRDEKAGA